MFEETLRQIAPTLRDGDVTMVVENYVAAAEVRGWRRDGEQAVRMAAELVDNATEAVQKHENLASAARTLATHAAALVPYRPVFWRKDKEIRAVDDVFVRTMRAAGTATIARVDGDLVGETIVYSAILRVGRTHEGGRLQARVRVEGRPLDVDVIEPLVPLAWELARTGQIQPIRLRGEWVEEEGALHLAQPEIVSLDAGYSPWSGRELLDSAKEHADLFSAGDFDRMLSDLHPRREE